MERDEWSTCAVGGVRVKVTGPEGVSGGAVGRLGLAVHGLRTTTVNESRLLLALAP